MVLPEMYTWTFASDLESLANQEWKPGESIPVRWKLISDSMTTRPSVPITLTISVLGPISSKEEVYDLIDQGTTPIVTNQVVVNDQTAFLKPRTMKLPPDMLSGTYGVIAYVEMAGIKTTTFTVTEVLK